MKIDLGDCVTETINQAPRRLLEEIRFLQNTLQRVYGEHHCYIISLIILLSFGTDIILRLLLCFSILDHVPKILSFEHPKGSLTCLNGIRAITFMWITIGHGYQNGALFSFEYSPTIGQTNCI